VPLSVSFGEQNFLDGVDMTAEGFAARMSRAPDLPTSSQPPVTDFERTYRRLLQYRDGVVSVHITSAMSGTYRSAKAAAERVDPTRIRVVDSRTVSVGAGLLIEAVGEMIAAGADLDEVEQRAREARADITVFGAVSTLDHAVRGGRVSPRARRLIDAFHLKPIIAFDEAGKARKGGVAIGYRRALSSIADRALRFADDGPARFMVVHTGVAEDAVKVADRLSAASGVDSVPVVRAGPVLSMHVGPGSVTVAVRRLHD